MEEKVPRKFYSNNVNVQMSSYDIAFNFGVADIDQKGKQKIDPVAQIIMSPQHAKPFAAILNDHVDKFEKLFGTMNLTPNPEVMQEVGVTVDQGKK